jgi:hypothetical protein
VYTCVRSRGLLHAAESACELRTAATRRATNAAPKATGAHRESLL